MTASSDQNLIHDLRQLIDAIDRRVPHFEREGEHEIALDATALKRSAEKRIAELEQSVAVPATSSTISS
jgi:hypothetical protein